MKGTQPLAKSRTVERIGLLSGREKECDAQLRPTCPDGCTHARLAGEGVDLHRVLTPDGSQSQFTYLSRFFIVVKCCS
jgi:hypothetical protein